MKILLQERIEKSLRRSKEDVFLRADFKKFGDYGQVGRALRAIVKKGLLVKAGYGVYVKAKKSSLTGNPVPTITLVMIGLKVLEKLGVKADLGRAAREYRDGKTTQMPMATVLDVGKSRISRSIRVGSRIIRYERNKCPNETQPGNT